MEENDEQKIAERREFLKKAGKAAVTVPAVALLLSATDKRAVAVPTSTATPTPTPTPPP
jgi:hypothetical protein